MIIEINSFRKVFDKGMASPLRIIAYTLPSLKFKNGRLCCPKCKKVARQAAAQREPCAEHDQDEERGQQDEKASQEAHHGSTRPRERAAHDSARTVQADDILRPPADRCGPTLLT